MSTKYDVVVIGGGISGLSAAYKLQQAEKNLKIVVLEAKARVGGRTLSTRLQAASGGQTDVWDLGGQWVSSSQVYILALLKELELEIYPQYCEGAKLLQVNGNEIKSYTSSIPQISFWAAIELHFFIKRVEKLSKQISVKNPYSHPKAKELDGMTFETFMKHHLKCSESLQLIEIAFRTVFGFDPSNMSCLYVLMYSSSAGGMTQLLETTEGAAQQLKVKGGTQQISFLLTEKLGPENVLTNHPVTDITQSDQRNSVTIFTASGRTFLATKVIVAIPVNQIIKINFRPALSEARHLLFQSMPVGHLTKFIITYEKAFWRDKKFSGEIVSNGGFPLVKECDTGPLGIVYDGTTHLGNPALVGFIAGHSGVQWSVKTPMERKGAILQSLAYFFGDDTVKPIDYAEKVWSNEAYNGGCPVNIIVPGMMKYVGQNLRSPCGRIHWAGTETSTVWCGYMDGAVQAGWRAAKEVLHDLYPGSVSEKDLSDTAYSKTDEKIFGIIKKSRVLVATEFALAVSVITAVAFGLRKIICTYY